MGKLSKIYGTVDKETELVLPVSGAVLKLHRPSFEEEEEISNMLGNKDEGEEAQEYLLRAAARILKLLCDTPNLRDEDEVAITTDLKKMEAPDRNCIVPYYNGLVRMDDDNLYEAVAKQLLTSGTKKKS